VRWDGVHLILSVLHSKATVVHCSLLHGPLAVDPAGGQKQGVKLVGLRLWPSVAVANALHCQPN
jgi:hypothetical protein